MRIVVDNHLPDEAPPEDELDRIKDWMLRAGLHRGIKSKMMSMLKDMDAPVWLGLTPAEKNQAAQRLAGVCDEYPVTSIYELIWCLAVDASRPHRRGRKSKWLGVAGVALVVDVNRELEARCATSSDRKALRQVIAAIKRDQPERYSAYTDERLRDAYYDALPRAQLLIGP